MQGLTSVTLLILFSCIAGQYAAPAHKPDEDLAQDVAFGGCKSNATLPLTDSICVQLSRRCSRQPVKHAHEPTLKEQIEQRIKELKHERKFYKEKKKKNKKELKRLKKQLKHVKHKSSDESNDSDDTTRKHSDSTEDRSHDITDKCVNSQSLACIEDDEHENLCDLLPIKDEEKRLCEKLVKKEEELREEELALSIVESMIRDAERVVKESRSRFEEQAENFVQQQRDRISEVINRVFLSYNNWQESNEGATEDNNDDVNMSSRKRIAKFATEILCEATVSKISDDLLTVRCMAANFEDIDTDDSTEANREFASTTPRTEENNDERMESTRPGGNTERNSIEEAEKGSDNEPSMETTLGTSVEIVEVTPNDLVSSITT